MSAADSPRRPRPPRVPAPRALTPSAAKALGDAPGSPRTTSLENPLIHNFPTSKLGDKQAHPRPPSGRPSAALRVSTFRARCQPALLPAPNLPRDMPAPHLAGAPAAVPAGPTAPALLPPSRSLLSAPARTATGGSAGRLPPPIHLFPMTLAGLELGGPSQRGAEPARVPVGGRGARP